MRKVFACGIVLAISFGLAGCSPTYAVYARESSAGPELLICDDLFEIEHIDYKYPAFQAEKKVVWTSSGPAVAAPATIGPAQLPAQWITSVGPDPISNTGRLYVVVKGEGNSRVVTFDLTQLDTESWLTNDGKHFSGDCTSAPGN